MSIVALSVLKSYFETGDKPTQAEFEDLIDTLGQFVGVLVPFKLALNNAQLLAGGAYDITQLPAPGAGYAWEVLSASARLTGAGTPFDGSPNLEVIAETASRYSWDDQQDFLSGGVDKWGGLIYSATTNSIVENKKITVNISVTSSVGDGSIVVYGMARLITM